MRKSVTKAKKFLRMARLSVFALILLPAAGAAIAGIEAIPDEQGLRNDYPTEARAEYVFACMASNGQSQEALRRCSCSIDAVASILSYEDYVAAETVLRMRQGGGERAAMFRGGTPVTLTIIADLRRAQAEAEMLCFG